MKIRFLNFLSAFIDSLIAAGGCFWFSTVNREGPEITDRLLQYACIFGVVFAFYSVKSIVFRYLFDKNSWLRRWFVPDSYIEGKWVQIIDDKSLVTIPPTKFSILKISFQDGQYRIMGDSFNQRQGKQMTTFDCKNAEFRKENNCLEYLYQFQTDEFSGTGPFFGHAQLYFSHSAHKRVLSKYTGIVSSNLPRDNVIKVKAIRCDKVRVPSHGIIHLDNETIKDPEVRKQIIELFKKEF